VGPESAIVANGLGRDYGAFTAVDAIDLDVRSGEFFGFLGPNGAGKTTLIRMLTTLLRPSRGDAQIAGHDIFGNPLEVRRSIGVVFQETTLDLDLTAEENLRFCARLYGLRRPEATARIADALALFGIEERGRERVRSFSGGMRRSLDLARGILHRPAILFLDEPTLGLDPPQRRRVWEHLGRLRSEYGTTLFLTTHYLEEADPCDRVAIINRGRLVLLGDPETLKRGLGAETVELEVDRERVDLDALAAQVRELSGCDTHPTQHGLSVVVDDLSRVMQALLPITASGVAMHVRRPTLDDVFLQATREPVGAGR
jgi:ABC-2 type transport system ATP-binding protein